MSEERTVTVIGSNKTEKIAPEHAPFSSEELQPPESRKERKARLARILERGIIADRLAVDLPADKYGEWVSDDPVEIARMQALGFEIDTEYAPKVSLHSSGSKAGKIGDVIHMTCSRENKDILEEIRKENYDKRHNRKPANRMANTQGEEREAVANIDRTGLPAIMESKTTLIGEKELASVISPKAH